MTDFAERRTAFRALHERDCFVIPNPWDIGTARALFQLGFRALATTSAGFAYTRGLPDGGVDRDAVLAHQREIVAATPLPVNADFQAGFGSGPAEVAESVRLCVETGVAGLSIEDSTGTAEAPLYELPVAVERLRAARKAIDATNTGTLLTGRAECYLVGHPEPLRESILRLQAYAEAGADVLYAPGARTPADIRAIVEAVAPKPVNVLIAWQKGPTIAELADLGARRISVGSQLAKVVWAEFLDTAKALASDRGFDGFDGRLPGSQLNAMFRQLK
jgi:2-methylisocitrate lyase-like PEP mutase family enzyme